MKIFWQQQSSNHLLRFVKTVVLNKWCLVRSATAYDQPNLMPEMGQVVMGLSPVGEICYLLSLRELQLKVALSQKRLEIFFHCQNKYSISLSWVENLNFPPKKVNNLFKFSAQDSDLEYLFWQQKNSPVSSDLKPPLVVGIDD